MNLLLSSPISSISRLTDNHRNGLKKLKLHTIRDLLYHFPVRYADMREVAGMGTLTVGESVTMYGIMEKVTVRRSFKGHIPMTEARVSDNTGNIRCIWFNQAYIGKMYPTGTRVKLTGTVQQDNKGLILSNPSIESAGTITPESQESLFAPHTDVTFLTPIYRETEGISSNYLYTLIKKAVTQNVLEDVHDSVPVNILKKLSLPVLRDALLYIHFPKNESLTVASRKRFAFEEIFFLQLQQYREKQEAKRSLTYQIQVQKNKIEEFISSFPFTPTQAQLDAIDSIIKDLSRKEPMGRLLEGDVGSGKTFVAATITQAIITAKQKSVGPPLQVAYMAPTELLARQHFESFISYFKGSGIEVGLLTGSGCLYFPSKSDPSTYTTISRNQLLTWIANGKISVVVGTHTLIQKTVQFTSLALVIIDEQHRFGIKQRKSLARRSKEKGTNNNPNNENPIPHLLSMTATPIPRTLALTIFGDLDITIIDTMPTERKKIITEVIPTTKRTEVYEHVRKELQAGRQVYVICPRIDEQDEEEKQKRSLKSVKEEAEHLANIVFPEFIVDVLHSKMKKEDKEEVMQDFLDKKSDILVATSVIEVGINVPNATVIIIEHADRFGLAQLHQLRGRVGRREYQSYCYLFTESSGEITQTRLKALITAKNGFELAEKDMLARGIGTLIDGKQWGMSDIAMEAIKNPKLVEIAKEEAKTILDNDPQLKKYPALMDNLQNRQVIHME